MYENTAMLLERKQCFGQFFCGRTDFVQWQESDTEKIVQVCFDPNNKKSRKQMIFLTYIDSSGEIRSSPDIIMSF